jgi:hypothetical protein
VREDARRHSSEAELASPADSPPRTLARPHPSTPPHPPRPATPLPPAPGITEAFVHAVLDAAALQRANAALVVLGMAHAAASFALVSAGGALGLVAADALNMCLRIAYSLWWVSQTEEALQVASGAGPPPGLSPGRAGGRRRLEIAARAQVVERTSHCRCQGHPGPGGRWRLAAAGAVSMVRSRLLAAVGAP